MGSLLIVRVRRAGWATALIAVAFMVPVLAWQNTGSRAVEREARRELAAAGERAQAAARNDAERWAWRLERLRADETQRPWYVYQPFFHDPEVLSQGVAVQRSPLARGPRDPLVAEYFRVTADGRLELPDRDASPSSATARDPASPAHALEPARLALAEELRRPPEPTAARTESIDVSAYTQNVQAAQLFNQLQTSPQAVASPRRDPRRVRIRTGTLRWRTLATATGPALAAVREVRTPEGHHLQGFVVSAEEFARAFAGGPARATFAPATGAGQPVGDTGWEVRVDDGAAVAEATARGAELRAGFARQFALGALAALVAAACAAALVIQADRVALERSRFAAAAAHELRTPLAGLRLYGDLLAEHAGDPDRTRSYAGRIAAESERLGRVVANVLGVTRLERGTLRVEPRVGDLAAATRAAVERQRPLLEAAGCRLTIQTTTPVEALFDPDALEPILQNLLDNAERHTREAATRDVVVRVEPRDRSAAIVVEDSGPGVPRELRHGLFRGTARRDANGHAAGLGLGLPLVATLARAQGADVAYDDAPGGGARFTVTFARV